MHTRSSCAYVCVCAVAAQSNNNLRLDFISGASICVCECGGRAPGRDPNVSHASHPKTIKSECVCVCGKFVSVKN
jgi:hypothetical protein